MLFEKYKATIQVYMIKEHTTIQVYMIKEHTQRVPEDELVIDDEPLQYLPCHTVFNPNKPGKTRVVFDSTVKFRGMSLNDQLLSGPDLSNSIVGVLKRLRQERVALTADV